ncbi:alpha-lytic protease prodomain-containing protein [Micromonospora tarensis]|uniref:alpha-lytic protease prodomain-containing protein n=1 Tax=Micromonospora tarensis TaxID=2806100 RepID=UPI0038991BF4
MPGLPPCLRGLSAAPARPVPESAIPADRGRGQPEVATVSRGGRCLPAPIDLGLCGGSDAPFPTRRPRPGCPAARRARRGAGRRPRPGRRARRRSDDRAGAVRTPGTAWGFDPATGRMTLTVDDTVAPAELTTLRAVTDRAACCCAASRERCAR